MPKCSTCEGIFSVILDGCPDAPLICSTCRVIPIMLQAARRKMNKHLAEHDARGDFDKLKKTPKWRDIWRENLQEVSA